MASVIHQYMNCKDWLMLVLLSVLWGGSFFFVEVALMALSPLVIVAMRLLISASLLWGVVLVLGYRIPFSLPVWRAFFIVGLLNNSIPFLLIVWGQSHISSGLASILNATTPLFTVLVAGALLRDEKIRAHKIMGVAIGLAGVVILIGPTALVQLGMNTLAQLAVLLAALSYSIAGVYGRRFKVMGIQPIVSAVGQLTASSLLLVPVMLVSGKVDELFSINMYTVLSLVGLATLSTALAYVLYFKVLASAGVTNISLVTFLIPVSAILLGVIVLGETVYSEHLVGMVFIGLGLVAIDGRILHK